MSISTDDVLLEDISDFREVQPAGAVPVLWGLLELGVDSESPCARDVFSPRGASSPRTPESGS